jgi:hypothetical protein
MPDGASKFVARFKYAKGSKASFLTFLTKNFTVEDLEKTFEVLSKNGVHFNAPPQHSPDGYAKVTFCRGPENLFLELVEVIKN